MRSCRLYINVTGEHTASLPDSRLTSDLLLPAGKPGNKANECNGTPPHYLIVLLEVGNHDDGGAVKLPYHAPEVRKGGGDGTLGSNVGIGLVVTLGSVMCESVCA